MRKINIHNKLVFALFAFFAAIDAVNIFSATPRLCGSNRLLILLKHYSIVGPVQADD